MCLIIRAQNLLLFLVHWLTKASKSAFARIFASESLVQVLVLRSLLSLTLFLMRFLLLFLFLRTRMMGLATTVILGLRLRYIPTMQMRKVGREQKASEIVTETGHRMTTMWRDAR